MPFKRHKNVFVALILDMMVVFFYTGGLLLSFPFIPAVLVSSITICIAGITLLVGIFFGFRSIKAKESVWAGHLSVVLGGVILASPLFLLMVAARW